MAERTPGILIFDGPTGLVSFRAGDVWLVEQIAGNTKKVNVRLARDGVQWAVMVDGNVREVAAQIHDEYCTMLSLHFAGKLADLHVGRMVEAIAGRLQGSEVFGQAIEKYLAGMHDEPPVATKKSKA